MLSGLAEAVTVNDDQRPDDLRQPGRGPAARPRTPQEVTGARPGELAARFSITDEDGAPVDRRRPPRPPAGQGRARARSCSPAASTRTTGQGLLAAHQGHAPARSGPRLRGQHHRGRHAGQGRRAAPALPGPRRASCSPPASTTSTTLQRVADLAVAWLADWCAVDLPDRRRRHRAGRARPQRPGEGRAWPRSCAAATRPIRRPQNGVPGVLRGGPPELFREIPDELLEQSIERPRAARGDARRSACAA